jgi:acetylornithine/succinyldiaminopimelate/putrescine aminotransferase
MVCPEHCLILFAIRSMTQCFTGSTYGGNPLAARVCMTALTVLKEEGMVENSFKCALCMHWWLSMTHHSFSHRMGEIMRRRLNEIQSPLIRTVRGRGLMNAVVINPTAKGEVRAAAFSQSFALIFDFSSCRLPGMCACV